jgi:hypothetical protein
MCVNEHDHKMCVYVRTDMGRHSNRTLAQVCVCVCLCEGRRMDGGWPAVATPLGCVRSLP